MKLTKEELQFIDKYLENSDVKYLDIRMELTDHIASAVEEKMQSENLDFYDAFKAYMAVNKKTLLNTHKYSVKKSFKILFEGFYHRTTLVFVFLSFIITQLSLMYFGELKTLFNVFLMCYILSLISLFLFFGKKRLNYSFVAYLGFSMVIVYQVFNLAFGFFREGLEKENITVYGFTLIILLLTSFMVFIQLYVIQYKKYKKIYAN